MISGRDHCSPERTDTTKLTQVQYSILASFSTGANESRALFLYWSLAICKRTVHSCIWLVFGLKRSVHWSFWRRLVIFTILRFLLLQSPDRLGKRYTSCTSMCPRLQRMLCGRQLGGGWANFPAERGAEKEGLPLRMLPLPNAQLA